MPWGLIRGWGLICQKRSYGWGLIRGGGLIQRRGLNRVFTVVTACQFMVPSGALSRHISKFLLLTFHSKHSEVKEVFDSRLFYCLAKSNHLHCGIFFLLPEILEISQGVYFLFYGWGLIQMEGFLK